MKAFRVKYHDKTISVALSAGVFGIIISNKDCGMRINCDGMNADGQTLTWFSSEFNVNDILTIELIDVAPNEISRYDVRNYDDEEENNRILVEEYLRLKSELGIS